MLPFKSNVFRLFVRRSRMQTFRMMKLAKKQIRHRTDLELRMFTDNSAAGCDCSSDLEEVEFNFSLQKGSHSIFPFNVSMA